VAALKDVSLVCAAGETVAVTGPSGSGKSTLLGLLAGLDDPDGGLVRVAGQRLSHQRASVSARLRARSVGVLTQASGLLSHLDVVENVRFAAGLRGGAGPSPDELVDGLGLAAVRHASPRTLSGGETARAGLAVALAGAPVLLLADEPTAEISSAEERTVLDLLRAWRPPGSATVIVTHSAAVAAHADRTVHLVDGRVR
jgi:putative ABC transport system ATP-binding protein